MRFYELYIYYKNYLRKWLLQFLSTALYCLAVLCLLSHGSPVQGARILAVLPIHARSHHKFFQPLLAALARAGHDLTVYSPFPLEQPLQNYNEVILDNVEIESDKKTNDIVDMSATPFYRCMDLFPKAGRESFAEFMGSDKISKLLTSGEKFDLVLTEAFTAQEHTLILGHIFNAPVIALQPFFTNNIINYVMSNDLHLSYIPDTCTPFTNEMSFTERIFNTFSSVRGIYYIYYHVYLPRMEAIMRERFPDMPPLSEMVYNVSMVFVNDHLTADYAQPRPPNILPVAGIHILDPKPLPEDLQIFMDKAPDGVILFSLGTYTPDHLQPKEYFDMFINVFKNLTQRVLWKTMKEHVEGLPDNVKTVKWLPQRDVLAHPNCVLFITHGGLLSQHEAVHSMVPVIAIPQFFDQHRNARFYEELGIGRRIYPRDLTEKTVSAAIAEVLSNRRYKDNMRWLSALFRDRPLSPQQSVVYWTEYVLRHGGRHLRPSASRLSWYQRTLLDVVAVWLTALGMAVISQHWVVSRLRKKIGKLHASAFSKKKIN